MYEHRRIQQYLPLLALVFAVALSACSEKHRSPTEPDFVSASTSGVTSASGAARGGNGGGNGNGNGGGRNPRGNPGSGLTLEIQPDTWNTNWEHSQGTVSALIRGQGLADVELSSIQLVGTDAAAGSVPALRTQRAGNHIRVFFRQSDAIETLDTPQRGEVHEVKIELIVDDEETTLTDRVRIVGPAGGGGGGGDDEEVDLSVEIQPDSWNMNWGNSAGTVSALIRGTGLDEVDLRSIELEGTDAGAAPVPALRAQRAGNHIRAFFDKGDAFDTLYTPQPGETHRITIRLSAGEDDEESELTDRIRVVGPSR